MVSDRQRVLPELSSTTKQTIGGVLGGACEAICLHWTDTIKTRLQLQQTPLKYHGAVHCFRTIVREEGFRALYKGLSPFTAHLMTKYSLRFYINSSFRELLADKEGKTSNLQNFLAGMSAGVTEAIVIVAPFEVLKTRLQAQVGLDKTKLKYKGPADALVKITREEGILALWNGVVPTIFRNATNQAFNFMSYDIFRRMLWNAEKEDKLAFWQTIITGAMAGGIGPLVNSPADIIKTRLMRQKRVQIGDADIKYKGAVDAFRKIWAEEGFIAFYKGLGPRLARIAPGQAITWTVVEQVRHFLSEY